MVATLSAFSLVALTHLLLLIAVRRCWSVLRAGARIGLSVAYLGGLVVIGALFVRENVTEAMLAIANYVLILSIIAFSFRNRYDA